MKTIPLSQGYEALVDDADYEWLSQWKWQAEVDKDNGKVYAVRHSKNPGDVKVTYFRMHRVIANTTPGMDTDHKDNNGLNNQRYNLRVCTRQQNQGNRQPKTNRVGSPYKGVYFQRNYKAKPWMASIGKNGKKYYLGSFCTPEEAALAYNQEAIAFFGEFALINTVK